MHAGNHPAHLCIVCLVLLCNCILLWATPARITEWPNLQIFGKSARVSLTPEVRHSAISSTSANHYYQGTSTRLPGPSAVSPSHPLPITTGCTGCRLRNQIIADNSDRGERLSVMSAAEKEYRVQVIKRQILIALHLPHPPVMTFDPPELAPEVVEKVFGESRKTNSSDEDDDVDDEYESTRTDKHYILGAAGLVDDNGHGAKLSFVVNQDVQNADVVRGKLWINVLNSTSASKCSIIVTQRFRRKYYATHVVAIHPWQDTGGWVGIDLSPTWSATEQPMVLEIITDSAQQAMNLTSIPILEMIVLTRVRGNDHRRTRRGINCQSNNPTSCCRQSFSVNKADLRWNWIIYPREIQVNYCRGSCDSGTNHIYNHSSVMYTRSMSETNASLRAQMMPCCTPKRLGTVQLVYYRRRTTVATKIIPNLKVLECGCA